MSNLINKDRNYLLMNDNDTIKKERIINSLN